MTSLQSRGALKHGRRAVTRLCACSQNANAAKRAAADSAGLAALGHQLPERSSTPAETPAEGSAQRQADRYIHELKRT
jgi:hypothetical protein